MVRDDLFKRMIRFTDLERQTLILSTHEIRNETGMDMVEWMTKQTKAGEVY